MVEKVNVTLALRRIDNKWEGAVISGGRFVRALVGDDLNNLVSKYLAGVLTSNRPEDTEVGVQIAVTEPDPQPPPTQEPKVDAK